jgi:hypothetical protein
MAIDAVIRFTERHPFDIYHATIYGVAAIVGFSLIVSFQRKVDRFKV